MPDPSMRKIADTLLSAAHQTSALGRMLESPGSETIVIDTPQRQAEAITFLLQEVAVLETLLGRLCSEVDALRSA